MPYLTKDLILDLKPGPKPYKVSDALEAGRKKNQGVIGLLVRVCPGGAKTFAVQYRPQDGGPRGWVPIGRFGVLTLEQARDKARQHLFAVSQGQNPAKERRETREAPTVAELVERYLEEHVATLGARSAAEYERLLKKHLIPKLGARKAKSIGTGDMADLLAPIRKRTPVEANRLAAVARKMFNLAELWQVRDQGTNPLVGQPVATETPRERRLHEHEIRALGQIIREVEALEVEQEIRGAKLQPESVHALAAVKLYLLAGPRKHELLCLQWPWVNLDRSLVQIPASVMEQDENGDSKLVYKHKTARRTGKGKTIYLCPPAVEILRVLPRLDGDEKAEKYNPHVIVGHRKGQPLVQIQDVWERLRKAVTDRAIFEAQEAGGKKAPAVAIADVTIHDLRRTMSSVAADLGHPELIIKAMLGHKGLESVTQIYTRLSVDPVRDAVNQVGEVIAGWLEGDQAP